MPEPSVVLVLGIGLAAGILSGVFGIGGGVIIVPALIYMAGFRQHSATGTSLAVLLPPIGIGAMWEYYRHGNVNLRVAMIMAIKDVAVSSGSACTSASLEPSYVLRALGVGEELAHSSIRFGIGKQNTEEEIDYVADLVITQVKRLRDMSPLYEMHQQGIDLSTIQWEAH